MNSFKDKGVVNHHYICEFISRLRKPANIHIHSLCPPFPAESQVGCCAAVREANKEGQMYWNCDEPESSKRGLMEWGMGGCSLVCHHCPPSVAPFYCACGGMDYI